MRSYSCCFCRQIKAWRCTMQNTFSSSFHINTAIFFCSFSSTELHFPFKQLMRCCTAAHHLELIRTSWSWRGFSPLLWLWLLNLGKDLVHWPFYVQKSEETFWWMELHGYVRPLNTSILPLSNTTLGPFSAAQFPEMIRWHQTVNGNENWMKIKYLHVAKLNRKYCVE